MGFGLEIGFIDHLYTQLVTTCNYGAIADLHTLQFTVPRQLLSKHVPVATNMPATIDL
jgi:hypothetical protein